MDSAKNGSIAIDGNMHIVKDGDGKIAYSPPTDAGPGESVYNTLFNPRGSKAITLTLFDGNKVWLNAESSIKYPTTFSGNERRVEITGEAYFEVAHNAKMPFVVSKGQLDVTVYIMTQSTKHTVPLQAS